MPEAHSLSLTTVPFRNEAVLAIETPDGVFIPIKPISDALGLKWHGQFERLQRNPVLSEGIRVIRIPSAGGMQEMVCLRLTKLHGWLVTIDASRIRRLDVREKVLDYQRECFDVLHAYFYGKSAAAAQTVPMKQGTDAEKLSKVRLVLRMCGSRAALEVYLALGLEPQVPSMFQAMRQGELFHGPVIDADTPCFNA